MHACASAGCVCIWLHPHTSCVLAHNASGPRAPLRPGAAGSVAGGGARNGPPPPGALLAAPVPAPALRPEAHEVRSIRAHSHAVRAWYGPKGESSEWATASLISLAHSWCNSKPITSLSRSFISHLLGHEGEGSIASYLKAKGWANKVYAFTRVRAGHLHSSQGLSLLTHKSHGPCTHMRVHVQFDNADWAALEVWIDCTDAGIAQVDSVVKAVFAYLHLIR